MEPMKFVLLLVLVSSVCEAAALPSCRWTSFRLRTLNEESTGLLESMGGRMPLECLEGKNISFPKVSFPEVVSIKITHGSFYFLQNKDLFLMALETLNGVSQIFNNNHTAVTWDREQLRLFQAIIDRQVENLQICVGKKIQRAMDKPANSSTDTLRSYFEKLEERLKEKEFSSCGWEMVRTELLDGLKKLQTFIENKN
ncbi:interferon a3-like [Hemibagrus wyckioides]|uniref:interferon a3-like n=1 Tax=Hemibagrus wyckioides TaxID=337641 RepID=UPI00266DACF0|nr:interferon a3-like [Hemibagrus wyckioides]